MPAHRRRRLPPNTRPIPDSSSGEGEKFALRAASSYTLNPVPTTLTRHENRCKSRQFPTPEPREPLRANSTDSLLSRLANPGFILPVRPHPPSKDQINQRTKESRPARAGANGTNGVVGILEEVEHGATAEARGPRLEAIGESRRRPIVRRRCGAADSGELGVDARNYTARRRLPGRLRTRRRVCWIRVRNRRDSRSDQNALQLRDERQTPVGMSCEARCRVQIRQEDRVSPAVCGRHRARPDVGVDHVVRVWTHCR